MASYFDSGVGERYTQEDYGNSLARTLNDFRKKRFMCDIVLNVGERDFLAHRNILGAASPYFNELFGEQAYQHSQGVKVELPSDHFRVSIMEDLLQFIYTGEVCVHQENVRSLVSASNYLKMENLKDIACRFFEKRLSPSNCLSISALADEFGCRSLRESADEFIFKYFVEVCKFEEFLRLRMEQVTRIIDSDEVNVKDEESVYNAVLRWVKFNIAERSSQMFELLQHVRLPLLSKYFLTDKVECDDLVMSDERCRCMVIEAKSYQSLVDRRVCYTGLRFKFRKSQQRRKILVAYGGTQERLSTREALCYVPSQDFWYPLAPMINARDNFGAAILDGKLFAVGGQGDDIPLRSSEYYDLALDRWTEIGSSPDPLVGHSVGILNGELYSVGGGTGEACSNEVRKYDAQINRWVEVTKLKLPRRGPCVVGHKHLYAIGGYGPKGLALDSVERYDPYTKEWAKIFPMISPRAFASGTVVGDKIYVVGGEYAVWSFYCSGEVFDIATDEWRPIADLSVPRAFAAMSVLDDRIFVIGGLCSSDAANDEEDGFVDATECSDVEVYFMDKNKWERACPLPMPTAALQCCSVEVSDILLESRCGIKF